MRLAFPLFGVALCLVPLACASTATLEEEMSKMRREMSAMHKELNETQLSVQRLEGQVTLLSVGRPTVQKAPETEVASAPKSITTSKNKAARAARDNKVLPVVRLGAKADQPQTDNDNWIDPGAQDDGSAPLVIKLDDSSETPHEKDRITVDRDVLKKPDPVLGAAQQKAPAATVAAEATSAELEAQYQAALAKLRGEGKASEALELFQAFREKHGRSNLADNAQYWIGECFIAMQSHDKAIAALELLAREYPKSSKRADALVRIGESWTALGDNAKASAAYQRAIDAYPKSDAAGRARARLVQLPAVDGGK